MGHPSISSAFSGRSGLTKTPEFIGLAANASGSQAPIQSCRAVVAGDTRRPARRKTNLLMLFQYLLDLFFGNRQMILVLL